MSLAQQVPDGEGDDRSELDEGDPGDPIHLCQMGKEDIQKTDLLVLLSNPTTGLVPSVHPGIPSSGKHPRL